MQSQGIDLAARAVILMLVLSLAVWLALLATGALLMRAGKLLRTLQGHRSPGTRMKITADRLWMWRIRHYPEDVRSLLYVYYNFSSRDIWDWARTKSDVLRMRPRDCFGVIEADWLVQSTIGPPEIWADLPGE